MLTARRLRKAMPGLPRSKAKLYAPHLNDAMVEGHITSKARAAAFLAQLAHESGDLYYMEEIADGSAYEGRTDLGNTHPGDGRRYKGRGPIQLTGRTNYIDAGEVLKIDLVGHPDKARKPNNAFRIAVWFWTTHGCNQLADAHDFLAITRAINGGYNGLSDRHARWERIKRLGGKILPGKRRRRHMK